MSHDKTIFKQKQIRENLLTITRDDYLKIIKRAYQKGVKDALKEVNKEDIEKKSQENAKEEGKKEAIKLNEKEYEQNRQRLKVVTERQDIVVLRVESVFPFSLFPDTLIIDTTKITIAKKQLFLTEYITTIPLKDLGDVNVQTFLFLATVVLKYMPQSNSPGTNEPVTLSISNLKRKDAIKAKNILKGAIVAKVEEIDIAKLSPEDIKVVLQKFGESEGVI